MRKNVPRLYNLLILASLLITSLTPILSVNVLGSPKRNVLYSTDPDLNLMTINPSTGVAEMVGPIGYSIEALAFSPEGILYATADIWAGGLHGGAQTLITINPDTGAGTTVGPIGYGDVDALAFAPDGALYGVDAGSTLLLEIDRDTGAGAAIGLVGYTFVGGMDFSPKGVLYAADMVDGGGQLSTLLTIDTSSGTPTEIGQIGFSTIEGIAFDKDGTLYGISALIGGTGSGELIKINTRTGAGAAVGMVEYYPGQGPLDMDALEFSKIDVETQERRVVYSAQGSWDEYDPWDEHAEVVGGHWNIKIRIVNEEYVVQWHSQYRELNLGGVGAHPYDQATGTIDHFKYYFDKIYSVSISDDSCILEVELLVHAKHHDPETLQPYWHWLEYGIRVIEINENGIWTGALTGTTYIVKY